MACYQLLFNKDKDFYTALKSRNPDIIIKMTKCVLSAIKRKRKSIDIFEITFKDFSTLIFTVDKTQYLDLLNSCLDDLVKLEEYELCAEIMKVKNKPKRTPKKKEAIS